MGVAARTSAARSAGASWAMGGTFRIGGRTRPRRKWGLSGRNRYENAGSAYETTTEMRGRRTKPLRKCGLGVRNPYLFWSGAVPLGAEQVAVHLRDEVERNALRSRAGALAEVGARAEALCGVLRRHREDAGVALRLRLRELAQVGDLRACEEHGRGVRAGRDARPAADALRGHERTVGVVLRDRGGVRIRGGPRVGRDVSAGLDDPVQRLTVHAQVLDDRERVGAPRLDDDLVTVAEGTHVQLAGGGALRTVRLAVDHHAAHAADALTTVAVEGDRLLALADEALVEDVEHLEERHVVGHAVDRVGDHAALVVRAA